MATYTLLSSEEIATRLAALGGWRLENGRLRRDLTFASFVEAFGFLTSLALLAERMNHHPEIYNVYNKVSLTLWTHDAAPGGGITTHDFALAEAAERLL